MTILFYFLLVASAIAQPIKPKDMDIFFRGEAEKDVEVYIFDGFDLSLINRVGDFIKEKVPVTKGNYFALFFIKDGYIPEVKVLKADKENINLGKIKVEKKMYENMGIITGVIYKPIHGGRISFNKGIFKLIDKIEIKMLSEKGESYLIMTNDKGIFCESFKPGKYVVTIGDEKEKIDVVIRKTKTTIQNIQKEIMLID